MSNAAAISAGDGRAFFFRARELSVVPFLTLSKPLQEGLFRKAESAETDAADVTPWRAMAEAVVRGYPRKAMLQHHAQLQQLLVDIGEVFWR